MPYMPTLTGGVYYTANTSGTPVWVEFNTGLASLNVRFLASSHVNPELLLLTSDAAPIIAKHSGSTWSTVYTNAEARTLLGESDGKLWAVCWDVEKYNYCYALYGPPTGLSDAADVHVLGSTDGGVTWAKKATLWTDWVRLTSGLFARDGIVAASINKGVTAGGRLFYSSDDGGTFETVTGLAGSSYDPWLWVTPSGLVLVRSGTALDSYDGDALSELIADQTPTRPDAMVLDTQKFVNSTGTLYTSSDDWATNDGGTAVDSEMQAIADMLTNTLSGTVGPAGGEPTAQVWNGVAFSTFNGTAPDNIPDTSGGVAYGPIGCTLLTGVTMSDTPCGTVATNYTFTLTLAPSDATYPTVVWSSDGLQSGQGTLSAVYQWVANDSGAKTVSVTATDCGATAYTASKTIRISNGSMRQDIYDVVNAVANTGNVYDYFRWKVLHDNVDDLVRATIDGNERLRTIMISAGPVTTERAEFRASGGKDVLFRTYQWFVDVWLGWNDAEESEKAAGTLCTAILDALDESEVLQSSCHYYDVVSNAVQADGRLWVDETTNYRRIQVNITKVESGT